MMLQVRTGGWIGVLVGVAVGPPPVEEPDTLVRNRAAASAAMEEMQVPPPEGAATAPSLKEHRGRRSASNSSP